MFFCLTVLQQTIKRENVSAGTAVLSTAKIKVWCANISAKLNLSDDANILNKSDIVQYIGLGNKLVDHYLTHYH